MQTLNNPDPAANDGFGVSVSISGNIVVVGASGDDTGAQKAGAAYVYELDPDNLTQSTLMVTLLNPDADADDEFGLSVAVSGNTVVVGARGTTRVHSMQAPSTSTTWQRSTA